MKYKVTDEAVHKWSELISEGSPTLDCFPGKMSDCEFTPEQREWIRQTRIAKKAKIKELKKSQIAAEAIATKQPVTLSNPNPTIKPFTKLQKMLYLQSGRCFFCGEPLPPEQASIEHLQPLSRGGQRSDDNEVVCHKSLNEAFGHLNLKDKVKFVLNQKDGFQCPKS